MGYNAAKKAREVTKKLEYVLAIELLSIYCAHQFMESNLLPGSASRAVLTRIAQSVPKMEEDTYLYPHLQTLREIIHSGEIIDCVEGTIGKLL